MASCEKPQTEFSSNYGTALPSMSWDRVAFRLESNNPEYSEMIIKQGSNPQPPENAVVLKRIVDPVTGNTTLMCGIKAVSAAAVPEKQQINDQMQAINVGILADANTARAAEAAIAGDAQNALHGVTFKTVTNQEVVTPLDAARDNSIAVANIAALLPDVVGTQKFTAAPRNYVPSGILVDAPPNTLIWSILFFAAVLIFILVAWRYREKIGELVSKLVGSRGAAGAFNN